MKTPCRDVPSIAGILLLAAVAACSGNYSGGTATGGGGGGGPTTPSASVSEFFGKSTQGNLNFCRTCHVPGGVADTPGTSADTQGNLFLLSSDPNQDYANLLKS
ncbi:MAG: hypothetical protein E6R07_08285, partial [Nevskiaceae bacterium]